MPAILAKKREMKYPLRLKGVGRLAHIGPQRERRPVATPTLPTMPRGGRAAPSGTRMPACAFTAARSPQPAFPTERPVLFLFPPCVIPHADFPITSRCQERSDGTPRRRGELRGKAGSALICAETEAFRPSYRRAFQIRF